MSTVSKSSQIVTHSQTLKSKASVKTPLTCDCTTAEAVSEPTFKMNEEQLKLIQDSLKTIQQTIQADLAKEAHTQRTKLDTLQSKLNKPDAYGLRGKHTLRCIICFEPTAIPTHRMPCCSQFIHEECLLQCFRHSSFHQGYRCPHCRGDLFPVPVDADDLTAETHPPPGH